MYLIGTYQAKFFLVGDFLTSPRVFSPKPMGTRGSYETNVFAPKEILVGVGGRVATGLVGVPGP